MQHLDIFINIILFIFLIKLAVVTLPHAELTVFLLECMIRMFDIVHQLKVLK